MTQDKEKLEKLETSIREYIRYESEQIHRRMTWVGSLQGFLFTAFGVLYAADHRPPPTILVVICLLGVMIALLILIAMGVGVYTVREVRKEVIQQGLNIDKRIDIFGHTPSAQGKKSLLSFLGGELLICVSLIVAWTAILISISIEFFR